MKIYGTHDDATINQLKRCVAAEEGAKAVLCADGHKGYSMPIGGVVAYKNFVSPSGVGYDIACGNFAVKTDIKADALKHEDYVKIGQEIQRQISFGIGRKNNEPVDSYVFEMINQSPVVQQRDMIQLAKDQLGTVGSGNHYVDVLIDEAGYLWVAVHFGSRGFGHKTASGFMSIANGFKFEDAKGDGEMDSPPLLLSLNTPSGQDYIAAMKIAGEYAYEGRRAVVKKVLEILGNPKELDGIHNHHNFTWEEVHNGETYWVVRKGATPAFPHQRGFVGGSMGDISVILEGVNSPEAKASLYSTVHGAGRVMSRTQAAGKQRWIKGGWKCGQRACSGFETTHPFANFKEEKPPCPICGNKMIKQVKRMERMANGLVNFQEEKNKLVDRGIVLFGAGADEAPPVYRPLQSVLDAHAGTINILHTLTPKIVVMAGSNEYDPYKD